MILKYNTETFSSLISDFLKQRKDTRRPRAPRRYRDDETSSGFSSITFVPIINATLNLAHCHALIAQVNSGTPTEFNELVQSSVDAPYAAWSKLQQEWAVISWGCGPDSRKDFENPSRYDPTTLHPLASERPFGTINCSLSLPFAPNQKVVTELRQSTRRGEYRAALRINARRESSCNAIIARYRSSDLWITYRKTYFSACLLMSSRWDTGFSYMTCMRQKGNGTSSVNIRASTLHEKKRRRKFTTIINVSILSRIVRLITCSRKTCRNLQLIL